MSDKILDAEAENIKGPIEKALSKKAKHVVSLIRQKIRDYAELNRLLASHESSDSDIAFAMLQAIDDFNLTPPLLCTYKLSNFPALSILIDGSIVFLLQSVGMLQTRNQLNYSTGDVTEGLQDKTPQLLQWIQLFNNTYEVKKSRYKIALNISNTLGGEGVASEYSLFNDIFE